MDIMETNDYSPIESDLNRLKRELETHVESGINIGKILISIKDNTPHGEFIPLIERETGLKERQCQNYMNIAQHYGQKRSQLRFSSQVLIELSRPSTPESAREAAEQEKSLTVKQSKELIAAHKRIKELESGKTPDVNNLIPQLLKKYKGASITIGMANRLSVLDEESQRLYLNLFESSQYANKAKQAALDEKLMALEDLNKISKERDEVKQKLDAVAQSDTAKILADKEFEIKKLKDEFDRQRFEDRKVAEKTASELHEKRFKDQIEKLEDEKKKAELKQKEALDKASASWSKYREMETEIDRLKSQLEVDNPTNIDNSMMKTLERSGKDFLIDIGTLGKEMEELGGGMEKSIQTVQQVIQKATRQLEQLTGSQDAIINV